MDYKVSHIGEDERPPLKGLLCKRPGFRIVGDGPDETEWLMVEELL